jgi:hypothetical protein
MTFLIADAFTDNLARVTGDEQKAVKTTAFDLQMNPSASGLSFQKLDRANDKVLWSVRANADVLPIVHRTHDTLLLCYVDHHDRACAWAERRKIETDPTMGKRRSLRFANRFARLWCRRTFRQELRAKQSSDRSLGSPTSDSLSSMCRQSGFTRLRHTDDIVGDDRDLQEVHDAERPILYIACTRARDRLWVSSLDPGSEFLDDLKETATPDHARA